MRIKQLKINKLFGMFDHDVPFKMDDRITIIYGPNGFGKTILLRIINGLLNGNFKILFDIPWESLSIIYDNNGILNVTKEYDSNEKKALIHPTQYLKINYSDEHGKQYDLKVPKTKKARIAPTEDIYREIQYLIPELTRISHIRWLNRKTGETLTIHQVIENYGSRLPYPFHPEKDKAEHEWFNDLIKAIPVHLIETQRLLPTDFSQRIEERKFPESAVTLYSRELSSAIQAKLAESATLSQSLDRTFPTRLVMHKPGEDLSKEQLWVKLKELEVKRLRLMGAGLLEKGEEIEVPAEIDETKKSVLSVYIEDGNKKLSIFDEMAAKIELLNTIITDHFKFKKLSISKEKGFIFINDLDYELSPDDLSSGEQHELVLLYELLFKVVPGSLILIDEPELSLHISWQENFLKDLEKITKIANLDVLIATHSPQIIYDRWDLTVELKEPNGLKEP